MAVDQPYYMLFVQSNEDVILVLNDCCLTCFESKTNDRILKKWLITEEEARQLKDVGTRGLKIKCICPKIA